MYILLYNIICIFNAIDCRSFYGYADFLIIKPFFQIFMQYKNTPIKLVLDESLFSPLEH